MPHICERMVILLAGGVRRFEIDHDIDGGQKGAEPAVTGVRSPPTGRGQERDEVAEDTQRVVCLATAVQRCAWCTRDVVVLVVVLPPPFARGMGWACLADADSRPPVWAIWAIWAI